MAPLPASNTARYFIYYRANGRNHNTQFRYDSAGAAVQPEIGFRTNVAVLLNAARAWMPTNLVYIKATFAAQGSNIQIPADLPLGLLGGVAPAAVSNLPASLSVTGKDTNGRAWEFKLLGAGISPANNTGVTEDYRVFTSENLVAAAIVGAVENLDPLSISGLVPIINQYVNMGYNAYWQKKARS